MSCHAPPEVPWKAAARQLSRKDSSCGTLPSGTLPWMCTLWRAALAPGGGNPDLTLTNVDPACHVMRHQRSAMEGCHETAVKGGLFLRHPALRHPALDVHLLACSTGTRALRIGAVPRPGHASHPSVGATPPTPPCGHGVSKLSLSQLTRTAGISSPINVIAAVGATPPTPPWGPRLPQLWCLR